MTTTKGLLIASSALLAPWTGVLAAAAFGIGTAWLAFAMLRDYGAPALDDPTRCPACRRDGLLRVEASVHGSYVPLLHCRECGEAFRKWGTTLVRYNSAPLY